MLFGDLGSRLVSEHVHDAIVLGAGVSGIYAIKRLVDLGLDAFVLEADDDLGGTWFRNRYPGCRFDSESYTYGYSWSPEILETWHWKELFSSQPENLRYLNFVADRYDLRRHMRFGSRVEAMVWDEEARVWRVQLSDGSSFVSRFVVPSIGPLSIPTLPDFAGRNDFAGDWWHTHAWPNEPVDLSGRRVGIVGTGATAIQIIAAICDEVGELTVFQRRPNWSSPLNNRPISEQEMADIRSRYDEIFAACATTPGGFEHTPKWGFWDATPQERRQLWDELYEQPGFAITGANYAEIYFDEQANRELSDYIADRIRDRVDDPVTAEKLIPRDHGFALQRLPLESGYFEAYTRPHVHLVDVSEHPIERVTPTGIQTAAGHHELDLIVYATGFDAITGAYDRIRIEGVGGQRLDERWRNSPSTLAGVLSHGFPNMVMVAGPQSVSGSTNFPRAIEGSVDFMAQLLEEAFDKGHTRIEAEAGAEADWVEEVKKYQERLLIRDSKGWFTGYNSNVAGHHEGTIRYQAYFGGAPRYNRFVGMLIDEGFPGVAFA